jgi:hypothetical protein
MASVNRFLPSIASAIDGRKRLTEAIDGSNRRFRRILNRNYVVETDGRKTLPRKKLQPLRYIKAS